MFLQGCIDDACPVCFINGRNIKLIRIDDNTAAISSDAEGVETRNTGGRRDDDLRYSKAVAYVCDKWTAIMDTDTGSVEQRFLRFIDKVKIALIGCLTSRITDIYLKWCTQKSFFDHPDQTPCRNGRLCQKDGYC